MRLRKNKSNRRSTQLRLESLETRRVMDAAGVGALDWGDAPDNGVQFYNTLATNNGAVHLIDPTHFLGFQVDAEGDGQPNATATGDDINNLPDEDGVQFLTPLVPGQMASVEVTASFDGHLSGWMDFNGNGKWDVPQEQIFSSQFIPGGPNVLNFFVPAGASTGRTYSRWRFVESTQPLGPAGTGTANGELLGGEVEDYENFIDEPAGDGRDWGDAPDFPGGPGYRTLAANNGAYHIIDNVHFLGNEIDGEVDGQPDFAAERDDVNGPAFDDEDGIKFLTPLVPGQLADVEVTANADGFLSAWMDFNGSGTWDPAAEQIFNVQFVPAGTQVLSFMVPAGAQTGTTYSRWRFTDAQMPLTPWGSGAATGQDLRGEVEDYRNEIEDNPDLVFDWGDAPDGPNGPFYNTLAVNNGAFHFLDGMTYLGNEIDAEVDGQPNLTATGDDVIGPALDDEDGIQFLTPIVPGQPVDIEVTANVDGFLNAWVDFNKNGMWDPAEQVFASQFVPAGPSVQSFLVPNTAVAGQSFARFRFTDFQGPVGPAGSGNILVAGLAGEVEDYEIFIQDEPQGELDWGDAPDRPNGPFYQTLAVNNGAFHVIDNVHFFGNEVDPELDGQPNLPASGDDLAGPAFDDEDGIRFLTPIVPGQAARVEVTANADAFFSAWMDFNRSGTWDHPAEQIFSVEFIPAGTHLYTFNVPATAKPGGTYSRWRITDVQTPLVPWGAGVTFGAINGEVEDYRNKIIGKGDFDGDGDYDCADIDSLVAEIASGANNPAFDLTGDLLVNTADRDFWLAEAGSANLFSQNPYLLGDANLDGAVNGPDFIIWNANKFTAQAAWCKGDFTADGLINGQDFLEWNANKFMNAGPIIQPAPGAEPGFDLGAGDDLVAGQSHGNTDPTVPKYSLPSWKASNQIGSGAERDRIAGVDAWFAGHDDEPWMNL